MLLGWQAQIKYLFYHTLYLYFSYFSRKAYIVCSHLNYLCASFNMFPQHMLLLRNKMSIDLHKPLIWISEDKKQIGFVCLHSNLQD